MFFCLPWWGIIFYYPLTLKPVRDKRNRDLPFSLSIKRVNVLFNPPTPCYYFYERLWKIIRALFTIGSVSATYFLSFDIKLIISVLCFMFSHSLYFISLFCNSIRTQFNYTFYLLHIHALNFMRCNCLMEN